MILPLLALFHHMLLFNTFHAKFDQSVGFDEVRPVPDL
jgi:hypothetical protein